MAYNFRPSGEPVANGFNDIPVQRFLETELYDRAQALIEDLAVATGNSPALDPGKITGSFCIVFDKDAHGNKTIGLLPSAPINADIINAGD